MSLRPRPSEQRPPRAGVRPTGSYAATPHRIAKVAPWSIGNNLEEVDLEKMNAAQMQQLELEMARAARKKEEAKRKAKRELDANRDMYDDRFKAATENTGGVVWVEYFKATKEVEKELKAARSERTNLQKALQKEGEGLITKFELTSKKALDDSRRKVTAAEYEYDAVEKAERMKVMTLLEQERQSGHIAAVNKYEEQLKQAEGEYKEETTNAKRKLNVK